MVSSSNLDIIAKATGFKQRKSTISPQAFLDTVFFTNAQSSPSLSEYSIDFTKSTGCIVSKQAIDKRFNERTKDMLSLLLQKVISQQIKREVINIEEANLFSEIRIMDSSEFVLSKKAADRFPGYGGVGREAIAQIQFEYELLNGKVTELSIGSARDSDSIEGMKNIDTIPENALLIRDLGYFSPKNFKEISKRGISFISRGKSQWNFYIKENDRLVLLSTKDIIHRLKKQREKYLDIEVITGSKVLTPVRLIANLLTKEQTKNRIKRKTANRGKLGKEAMESSCLNLFVTNIQRDVLSPETVYRLYTLRWQVELIFKTWKSILKVNNIHSMNPIRLECIILIKLLWIMLNWSILKLLQAETQRDISLHKLTHTMMSRSKILKLSILRDYLRLYNWLLEMMDISILHHQKEYKRNCDKMPDIISCTYIKTA